MMFGYGLRYLTFTLDDISKKKWFPAILDCVLTLWMFSVQIDLLRIVAGIEKAPYIETTPMGLNVHLVGPVMYVILVGLAILGILLSYFIEWVTSSKNYYSGNNYPGKILLNHLKLWRKN